MLTQPAPPPNPSRWRADLSLAFVAFIWGSTFVLVKGALDDVSTVLFLALRFGIATVALGFVYARRHGVSVSGREWKGGLVTGTFLLAGYVFQTLGLKWTTPAKSGFITGLYIVLVPFLIAIVYRKGPQISEVIGAACATVGLALLSLTGVSFVLNKGDLLTMGCAVCFAAHILALGHYSKKSDHEWLAFLQIGTCAAIAFLTFPFLERPYLRPSPMVWTAVGVTSILATAVAFTVQTWAQRFTTTMRTALIFALEPVFAWITSFVVSGEVLTARGAAGAGMILAGILMVELKPIERHKHRIKQT